jgi:hypothetical protein
MLSTEGHCDQPRLAIMRDPSPQVMVNSMAAS